MPRKVQNPTVTTSTPNDENPYKKGSAKRKLFAWALAKKTFTKEEFLAEVARCLEAVEFESVMAPDVCGKAWFNEFYAKHKVFVDAPVKAESVKK